MISNFFISNFKSLYNFSIDLSPMTVIIGENSSGKSSVLQALDFVCKFSYRDTSTYLDNRDWIAEDILCKYLRGSLRKIIHFRLKFELPVDGKIEKILWEVQLEINSTLKGFSVIDEAVYLDTGTKNGEYTYPLFRANRKGIFIKKYTKILNDESIEQNIPFFSSDSSFLKIIDNRWENEYPILVVLKKYLMQSESFELLSPSTMRQGSRGTVDSIGYWGEKLGAYIKGLPTDKRNSLVSQIKELIPFVSDIQTNVKGRPGWIELSAREQFGDISTIINSKHISDGLLRIIALFSISESSKTNGLILLDEIENGINPYLAERVVKSLKSVIQCTNRQVVVTTHSSVMLDYFEPNSIVYMSRRIDGRTHASAIFNNPSIKERLDYLYPGEAWLNLSHDELINAIDDNDELKG